MLRTGGRGGSESWRAWQKADLSWGSTLIDSLGKGLTFSEPQFPGSGMEIKDPLWSSGWDPTLPLQGARVRELRSHMLRDMAKKRMKWRSGYLSRWDNVNMYRPVWVFPGLMGCRPSHLKAKPGLLLSHL